MQSNPGRALLGKTRDSGMTLRVRLSLLITALLALVTLAGGIYVVHKARSDTQAEVKSTLTLAGHFLDAQIAVLRDRWTSGGYSAPLLHLHDLGEIRHLTVRFYDAQGRLLDSNDLGGQHSEVAPRWFALLVGIGSPGRQTETRTISFDGTTVGRLVIAPDPSYETEEMWTTSRGLLALLMAFFALVNAFVWWAVSRAMEPVEQILSALEELRGGNLAARLPRFGASEMARIGTGFNHLAETLERSVAENRSLTRRLLEIQENERTSLARELHDEIGQCVSAIHADAVAIRNRGGETVRESAQAIVEVAARIKEIVRSMLQKLRPPALAGLGLTSALGDLVAAFAQRHPHVSCSLKSSSDVASVQGEIGVALYRVVQECLTNVARHAHARHTAIEVTQLGAAGGCESEPERTAPPTRRIRATIADDGVGFAAPAIGRGLGLTGIRERVVALGGTYSIDSHPGRGTRISVEVPLTAELEALA
ncbi:MAG TPA: ATP-binding protein [Steroidobacteraceae bacterium]|nr:ATP-binding protein [Steroidobacteraceae bacterium]